MLESERRATHERRANKCSAAAAATTTRGSRCRPRPERGVHVRGEPAADPNDPGRSQPLPRGEGGRTRGKEPWCTLPACCASAPRSRSAPIWCAHAAAICLTVARPAWLLLQPWSLRCYRGPQSDKSPYFFSSARNFPNFWRTITLAYYHYNQWGTLRKHYYRATLPFIDTISHTSILFSRRSPAVSFARLPRTNTRWPRRLS
jgi:hypothetical protein